MGSESILKLQKKLEKGLGMEKILDKVYSEGARLTLVFLLLSSYLGENVTDCATEAQHIIKLMQIGYDLLVSTGSHLLGKFALYKLLDIVRDMEHKCKLPNPKDITSDPNYKKLGRLGPVVLL